MKDIRIQVWGCLVGLLFALGCGKSEPSNPLGTLNMDWKVGDETRQYSFFIQPDLSDTTYWLLSAISTSAEGSVLCGSRTLWARLPKQVRSLQPGTYALDSLGSTFTYSNCDSLFTVYGSIRPASGVQNWIQVETATPKEVRLRFHLVMLNMQRTNPPSPIYPDSLILNAGPITVPVEKVF